MTPDDNKYRIQKMKSNLNKLINRLDANRVEVVNPYGVSTILIANEEVPIELDGIKQLLGFLSLQETINYLQDKHPEFFKNKDARIDKVVITPDFHRGGGIPIGTVAQTKGFVIPSAVGNDICCGMRLLITDVTEDELRPHLDKLEQRLRAIYFGGERDIPMSPTQRSSLLTGGLPGLNVYSGENENNGIWKYYDKAQQSSDLSRVHFSGSLISSTGARKNFDDFIRGSGATDGRDAQIGSIGGGNHFVEIQAVKDIYDGSTAYNWGLSGNLVSIMAHSGSVGLGHAVGGLYDERARALYPKDLRRPDHNFYMIPDPEAHEYLGAMNLAANFAFGNRLFLGLMAIRAMSEVLGRKVNSKLIYDAPHNLIWGRSSAAGGDGTFIHRKGACPAHGMEQMQDTPFEFYGSPVIIPGSMGASSFVMAGMGNEDLLSSACHGAGRNLTRGEAHHVNEDDYKSAMEPIRVVTPIDPKSPQIVSRRDILDKYHTRLKEEAPFAYKPITPVIDSVEGAGVARRVARLWPMMTVKG